MVKLALRRYKSATAGGPAVVVMLGLRALLWSILSDGRPTLLRPPALSLSVLLVPACALKMYARVVNVWSAAYGARSACSSLEHSTGMANLRIIDGAVRGCRKIFPAYAAQASQRFWSYSSARVRRITTAADATRGSSLRSVHCNELKLGREQFSGTNLQGDLRTACSLCGTDPLNPASRGAPLRSKSIGQTVASSGTTRKPNSMTGMKGTALFPALVGCAILHPAGEQVLQQTPDSSEAVLAVLVVVVMATVLLF